MLQATACSLNYCGLALQADIAVLEEPEHLNWYHHGRRWTEKFNHVVGVMHTNYLDYAKREEHGVVKSAALAVINHLMCRLHCHKVRINKNALFCHIALSVSLQGLVLSNDLFACRLLVVLAGCHVLPKLLLILYLTDRCRL